ncbi:MAG: nucleotidyltransferase family protein [Candidatus Omnitrophica bacterium]|nr:nucleotidyltransferase family protein [Candidatus Omnitrophota bacterium]
MVAMVLAGGFGLRLRKIISDMPKPMASINGKPFLEYLILWLRKYGFEKIVLSVGFKSDIIKEHFKTGKQLGVRIDYSEETEPLGTAGAIKQALSFIEEDNFLVINGDSFLDINLNQLISAHIERRALATIGLTEVEDSSRYGTIRLDGNKIIEFTEKNTEGKGWINGGCYYFNKKINEFIKPGKVSLEKEVLPFLIQESFFCFKASGFFIDIGIPTDYYHLSANSKMLENLVGI